MTEAFPGDAADDRAEARLMSGSLLTALTPRPTAGGSRPASRAGTGAGGVVTGAEGDDGDGGGGGSALSPLSSSSSAAERRNASIEEGEEGTVRALFRDCPTDSLDLQHLVRTGERTKVWLIIACLCALPGPPLPFSRPLRSFPSLARATTSLSCVPSWNVPGHVLLACPRCPRAVTTMRGCSQVWRARWRDTGEQVSVKAIDVGSAELQLDLKEVPRHLLHPVSQRSKRRWAS
jgi:hypothetical protein